MYQSDTKVRSYNSTLRPPPSSPFHSHTLFHNGPSHIGLHERSLWFDGGGRALPGVTRELAVHVVLVGLCYGQSPGHLHVWVGGRLAHSL